MDHLEVLHTGYEGEDIDFFVDKLVVAEIEILVDVRKLPLSRKKGFSKNGLRERLASCDIDYLHMPQLGMPDHLRKLKNELSDNLPILEIYEEQLPLHRDSVSELATILQNKRGCLMCFEADSTQCHRLRLANHLVEEYEQFVLVPLDQ